MRRRQARSNGGSGDTPWVAHGATLSIAIGAGPTSSAAGEAPSVGASLAQPSVASEEGGAGAPGCGAQHVIADE